MDDHEPSRQTMDKTPPRLLLFLRGVGTTPIIRSTLALYGYTEQEHNAGWAILHKVSGFTSERASFRVEVDSHVNQAVTELDAWDEPNFERIEAMLRRRFPEQAEFVFQGLQPATGAAAVLSVSTLLSRIEALESGAARKSTRKEDHAAIELLGQRGYTKAERDRLRALVRLAQHGTTETVEVGPDPEAEKLRVAREAALREAHDWYRDWTATARAVIKRRDYLIRLGLMKRRRAVEAGSDQPVPDLRAPAPPATAP